MDDSQLLVGIHVTDDTAAVHLRTRGGEREGGQYGQGFRYG